MVRALLLFILKFVVRVIKFFLFIVRLVFTVLSAGKEIVLKVSLLDTDMLWSTLVSDGVANEVRVGLFCIFSIFFIRVSEGREIVFSVGFWIVKFFVILQ